ncbi:NADH dehydrogenase [ubiquinone] 1 beta subcomplex subunit 8, mitochondrial [Palaemon carinicauda]|uniref:NADH dehydrogenase [ubiquinone] 1 beta subcomplex subunit 8, mitochondrial n=1 Tax=Palaemon carinicauda TaxID=392227 RepID=UPI0035B6151F
MAALLRLSSVSRLQNLTGIQLVRCAGNWNKDWKPSPYPVTKEQREAAARKYGLRPDEYEPYPDDGMGRGDYPKLPLVSADARDPYRNWDYPEHRRDFGEPIHVDYDMHLLDRVDVTTKPRFTLAQQALSFFGVMIALFTTYFYFQDKKLHWNLLPKQYPGQGKAHYTFEAPE